MVGHAHLFKVSWQDVLREAWLLLIHIDGDQFEVDGRAFLQAHQNFEHGVRVLATRQTHHDFVTVFNHPVIFDGFANVTTKALLELVEFGSGFAFSLIGCSFSSFCR